jgi:hypothetical protein
LFKARGIGRILTLLLSATIGLAYSASPCAALSTPSVVTVLAFSTTPAAAAFTARAVPVPEIGGGSWPNTGNFLGGSAAIEFEIAVKGSGYGATARNPKGGVPPISQLNLYFPAGMKLNSTPFGGCTTETLKILGPSGCPRTSFASPTESLLDEVTAAEGRVPEQAQLQAVFGESGLLFSERGHNQVLVEDVWHGHYLASPPPYGEVLVTEIPAVVTAPGGALRAVREIHLTLGAMLRTRRRPISYLRLPRKCRNGLPFKIEVTFAGEAGFARTVTSDFRAPCPKKLRLPLPSAAQIAAQLSKELVPSGKSARIGVLLKRNGYARAITGLEAGTVRIAWYRVPRGATLASKSTHKPLLIAAGGATFSEAGSATVQVRLTSAGRRLLKHTKKLRLIAKGAFTPVAQTPVVVLRQFALRR